MQKPVAATPSVKTGDKGPTRNDLATNESKLSDATVSDQTSAFGCGNIVNACIQMLSKCIIIMLCLEVCYAYRDAMCCASLTSPPRVVCFLMILVYILSPMHTVIQGLLAAVLVEIVHS